MHQPDSSSSDSLYPQTLLEAIAGNDDSATKHDVETIARNLSGIDDALFYLKTISEVNYSFFVSFHFTDRQKVADIEWSHIYADDIKTGNGRRQ